MKIEIKVQDTEIIVEKNVDSEKEARELIDRSEKLFKDIYSGTHFKKLKDCEVVDE